MCARRQSPLLKRSYTNSISRAVSSRTPVHFTTEIFKWFFSRKYQLLKIFANGIR